MTFGTPVAVAAVLDLGGATRFGYRPDGIGWLLAAVASGLPDVDLPPAKIGRLFWFLSGPLERRFGHRTLTHSAIMRLAIAALAALAAPLSCFNRAKLTNWESGSAKRNPPSAGDHGRWIVLRRSALPHNLKSTQVV